MKLLLLFGHGLGDAVQLGVVLQHLRHYHPDWTIHVGGLKGKESAWHGLCDRAFNKEAESPDRSAYDRVLDVRWGECFQWLAADRPSTKAMLALAEDWHLDPVPSLLFYRIQVGEAAMARARKYVESLPFDGRFACIHHRANTSSDRKDLAHADARAICDLYRDLGYAPVVLDWDRRTPFLGERDYFNPGADDPLWMGYGTGDAETLAALLSLSSLNVCVDSGPQKVALAVRSPTLCVWTGMQPLHYIDGSPDSALHIVPEALLNEPPPEQRRYLAEHYRVESYLPGKMMEKLLTQIHDRLVRHPAPPASRVPAYAVGVPTLNRYDLLKGCLESVLAQDPPPARVLVCDNGRTFENPFPGKVEVIKPGRNLGCAGGWNLLCDLTDPLPLVLVNDDLRLAPDVCRRLLLAEGDVRMADGFSCFMVTRETRKEVGRFDETFAWAYFEDGDYAQRVRMSGRKVIGVPGCEMSHSRSSTIANLSASDRAVFDRAWANSRNYYLRKWGGPPDHERYVRPFNGMNGHAGPDTVEVVRAAKYAQILMQPSDISDHLPRIHELAKGAPRVTVWGGGPAVALACLHAQPLKLTVCDPGTAGMAEALKVMAGRTEFVYHAADGLELPPEETDLLVLDTTHTRARLMRELEVAGHTVRERMVIHDTATFAEKGEDGGPGMQAAIDAFLAAEPWVCEVSLPNCNGLTVLAREEVAKIPDLPEYVG
jgi:ADP-heptose:LPS heptosyltransferase